MYPAHLFALFPPFPREEKVFVAMSFDARFEARWKDVIDPAVRSVEVNGSHLEPYRVDARKVSDSILTEILSRISSSRLVLADITTIGMLDTKPIRNGNVMYEIGLAHAVRLPEEVILFRSDADALLFDTSNIRVNLYSPDDDAEKARGEVKDSLNSAIREIDLRKHLAVRKAVESLDYPCWSVLIDALSQKRVPHPKTITVRDALANDARVGAIARLLEMGALRTKFVHLTPEHVPGLADRPASGLMHYECTEFGQAIYLECADRLNLAGIRKELEAL